MRGLWTLTWLEIKIFVREPLGLFGTVGVPVLVFFVMTRVLGTRLADGRPPAGMSGAFVPLLSSILMVISAAVSLVTIIAVYREGGILKRLRATPLRPQTILTAHVIVKLLLTTATFGLTVLAGRRVYPMAPAGAGPEAIRWMAFGGALLFCTVCILSVSFLIASLVPTARLAQPFAGGILYAMLPLSGLFIPVSALPPAAIAVSGFLPLTHAVSLLEGVWNGHTWWAHAGNITALLATFALCTMLSARVFRWE